MLIVFLQWWLRFSVLFLIVTMLFSLSIFALISPEIGVENHVYNVPSGTLNHSQLISVSFATVSYFRSCIDHH